MTPEEIRLVVCDCPDDRLPIPLQVRDLRALLDRLERAEAVCEALDKWTRENRPWLRPCPDCGATLDALTEWRSTRA